MFKLVFWVCLAIMFIPVEQERSDLSNQPVSTQETLAAASTVYGDLKLFCSRNPQTCDTGRYYVTQFKRKASAGANMVIAYLNEDEAQTDIDAVTTSSLSK